MPNARPSHHPKRRALIALGVLLSAVPLASGGLAAQGTASSGATAWPSRSIRLVIPFPPGGATDIIGRTLAQKLTTQLGQPVVVDNRPGAGGTLGSAEVAKAPADGYTLLLATTSTHSVAPSLFKTMPYSAERDFTPVSEVATATNVLIVAPTVNARDVRSLIALAKGAPDTLNYASSGNGTIVHLQAELFRQMAGISLTHVPYKGTALAIPDLISGQTQLLFDSLVSALPHIKSGKVKALAVTSAARTPLLPSVPTVIESGLPGYEVNTYFGLFGPAGLSRDIQQRLLREVQVAVNSADARERFAAQGTEPVGGTPDALAALMRSETVKWKRVIDAGQVRVE
ncbi:MAG: tripartite tricarboxylate transporter substrate binding protein [Burkholderiales bacterium]|nr:tripartite tricarboxylate transporter substrate binding protein [Burkholderiales bacterium]